MVEVKRNNRLNVRGVVYYLSDESVEPAAPQLLKLFVLWGDLAGYTYYCAVIVEQNECTEIINMQSIE